MPSRLDLLEQHLASKRYVTLKDQQIDLSKYPYIVESDKGP